MTRRSELLRSLGSVAESPCRTELAGALDLPTPPPAPDHTEMFLIQTHPYASVHLGPEGMLGGDAADRVAGFWRTLSLDPPNPPDHLAVLLGLYARICEEAITASPPRRAAALDRARRVLLWEHLLSWAPTYLLAVAGLDSVFHRAWAQLLIETLVDEALDIAEIQLPAGLRMAPQPEPPASRDELVHHLLCPVRSGVVITKADLRQSCADLGLGLRQGERAYILAAMLDQAPSATMAWLAERATAWAYQHAQLSTTPARTIAAWWEDRARRTATTISDLSRRPQPARR